MHQGPKANGNHSWGDTVTAALTKALQFSEYETLLSEPVGFYKSLLSLPFIWNNT